jgi:hypothetical protein|nr:MAG TPA: hypothetical protein [Caudoviricetes sp.]
MIVKVNDLFSVVKDMKDDGMDFVELSFLEKDTSNPDDIIPASIFFEAWSKKDPECGVGYDDVFAVED